MSLGGTKCPEYSTSYPWCDYRDNQTHWSSYSTTRWTQDVLIFNELDEFYGTQRSYILMMTPLPSIETACSLLEPEEAHRDLLS